jgi:integrase/recombinase XerD
VTQELEDLSTLERFAEALWLERGLSRNTLVAYQSDLRKLADWLRNNRGYGLLQAQRADLLSYLADLDSGRA